MVGNKVAQKAIAAALTGMLAFGAAAPALAGVKEGSWWRVNGDHTEKYTFEYEGVNNTGNPVVKGKFDDEVTVAGVNRYDTMWDAVSFNAANDAWFDDADPNITNPESYVVLVSGTSYADALAASAVAGVYDAPIITTPADKLGLQAEQLIKWFASDTDGEDLKVLIVGGPAAVSDDVYAAVDAISEDDNGDDVSVKPVRISGKNRMETSTAAARWVNQYAKKSTNIDNVIFVANGYAWADALSVSSYSYRDGYNLLLTGEDGKLTESQLSYLKSQLSDGAIVCAIGGPAKLAYEALDGLNVNNGGVLWLSGSNRYDTSRLVVEKFGDTGEALAVATGENWPDALIGGAFVGAQNGTLVLVGEQDKTANFATAVEAAIKKGFTGDNKYILGGTAAVSDETATVLNATL